jgi:ABC-type spermidine/putrescine transport system permease subunit II
MKRNTGKWLGLGYYVLLLVFLQLPILILILFSFNDSVLLVFPLKGFTLKWYEQLLGATELLNAAKNSLIIGAVSSVVATALGTAAAIAIARFNFRGRGAIDPLSGIGRGVEYLDHHGWAYHHQRTLRHVDRRRQAFRVCQQS